jgi:formamidopyrimidine-DNA glycosylase
MPELPEVETVVRDLRKSGVEGLSFKTARVFWHRTVAPHLPEVFVRKIKDRKIVRISRRAKFIVFQLEPAAWLLVHLRMTGRLDLFPADAAPDPYVRISALLSDGRELRFKDIRKFGRWSFYEGEPPQFRTLGPEPLEKDFTVEVLTNRLSGHSRQMKPLLLDQTVVAGLGNIYVDEALWEAGIHPLARSQKLKKESLVKLHKAIVNVLQRGVKNSGTTLGKNELNYYSVGKRSGRNQDELQVFRKTGAPCPRCETKIIRLIVGQRSSHVCVKCQKKS